MEVKGLIFDMDGTMFDTEPISIRAMQYAAKKHRISLPMEMIYGFMGLPGAEIRRRFEAAFPPEQLDFDAYLKDKIAYQDRVIEENGVPIKPGLPEVLAYAKERQIPCAVATSTNRQRATSLITQSGLISYFSAIVCGNEVAHGKPAPDIFLRAAEEIHVSPACCIGIEDSKNGITALHRTPMLGVLIPDVIVPDAAMLDAADLKMESLFDFLEYLKKITA